MIKSDYKLKKKGGHSFKYLFKQTQKLRNRHFFLIDIFIVSISPLLTLFFVTDGQIDFSIYGIPLVTLTILFATVKLFTFYFLGLYQCLWKKASIDDLAKIIFVGLSSLAVQYVVFILIRIIPVGDLNINIFRLFFPFKDGFITIVLVSITRLSVRLSQRTKERFYFAKNLPRVNTLIVGAGDAGIKMVEELQRNPQVGLIPSVFIDDNKENIGLRIRGLDVIGNRYSIPEVVKEYDINKIIIAMPSMPGLIIREIMEICQTTDVETFTMPGMYDIVGGKVSISQLRKIEIEDLLRREPISTDTEKVKEFIFGKRILISGAGGSIGSELCRQILKYEPSEILLLGHGENSIFEIEYELKEKLNKNGYLNKDIKIISRIADLRFADRLEDVFNEFLPDVVLHAAAHKHVPLMEENPSEAITNNILGTKNLVDASLKYNVKNFVLISTDKVVKPTSIMGASKRVAELIVLNAAKETGQSYCSVRFGNVLGSRGSVIKTFNKQIQKGGPITVTDPEIVRYFITIPEAVQLVLQASVLSKGGEVFMLDMGKPVKIVDLAKDVIRLSGLEEGRDIKIEFTGLRPGEKLYEELFVEGENYEKTIHEKIFIARNSGEIGNNGLMSRIQLLIASAMENNYYEIISGLMALIPAYTPGKEQLQKMDKWSTDSSLRSE